MARPNFNIQGVPPKMKCKAADGDDCDMREVRVRRNATTGVTEITDWQCINCKQRKSSKF